MKNIKFRLNLKLLFHPIYVIRLENPDVFKNKNTPECLNFLPSHLFNFSIKSFLNKHNIPALTNRLKLNEICIMTSSISTIKDYFNFISFNLPICNTCHSKSKIVPHKVSSDSLLPRTTFDLLSINNISVSFSVTKLDFDSEDNKELRERILKHHILNNLMREFDNFNLSRNQDLIELPSVIQVSGLRRDQIVEMVKWKVIITINNHFLKVYVQPVKMLLKYFTDTDALCNYKCLTWPNFTKAVVPDSEHKCVNKDMYKCLEYYWMSKYNFSLQNSVEYFDVYFNVFKKEGHKVYFELSESLKYPADCLFKDVCEESVFEMPKNMWCRFVSCLEGIKIDEEEMMAKEKDMTKVQKPDNTV